MKSRRQSRKRSSKKQPSLKRSLRLSRKQKRLLKTYSRKLQSRLGIWDKMKSAVKMDDTSIAQRALKKEMGAAQKSAQTQFNSNLSEIKSNIASAQKRINDLESLVLKQNDMITLKTQQQASLTSQLEAITKDLVSREAQRSSNLKELNDLKQKVIDFENKIKNMSTPK